jgi:undecaprenyl-diphosphatase
MALPIVRKLRYFFHGREPLVFASALIVVLGTWGFMKLLGEVREGETARFDTAVLQFFRDPADPNHLNGPRWLESVVRDVTALGGAVVLGILVASVAGFLLMTHRYHMMWLMLAATVGAVVVNTSIKRVVDRPRPTVVPRLTDVTSESFPSGHSAMSAAVYLTIGGLLAQTVSRRRIKLYFLSLAMLATFLVGLSRVALGVHYPTDVLGGWAMGLVWALLCWLVARYLQRRGAIEPEEDPTTVNDDKAPAPSRTSNT